MSYGVLGAPRITKGIAPLEGQIVPPAWSQAAFGPGQPVRPGEQPWEEGVPREFEFSPSVNATIIPRIGYGLMPFGSLTDIFSLVSEVKLATHLLCREFTSIFRPALIELGTGEEVSAEHDENWMCDKPDRQTPFDVWIKRFIQDAKAWDAATVYYDRAAQAIRYVGGDTIFVMVDHHGRQPKSPEMAFTQVIQGTAMQWFSTDEIHYRPMQPQLKAPYGMTPIEDGLPWIQILAALQGFEIAYYTEGNTPEGFLGGLLGPDGGQLDPAGVVAWEQAYNARLAGTGPAERRRIQILPSEKATWIPTKKPDFPKELYAQARDNVLLYFGVPPSETGSVGGRALSAGLGGKSSANLSDQALFRMGLGPLKTYVEGMMNDARRALGCDPSVKFQLQLPAQDMDQASLKDQTLKAFINGLMTLNSAAAVFGQPPIEGGDVLMVVRNGTIVSVSDFLAQGAGAPGNEEEVAGVTATQDAEATDQDTKLAQRILETGSTTPTKTISTPTGTPCSVQAKEKAVMTAGVAQGIATATPKIVEGYARTIRKNSGVAETDDAYFGAPCSAAGSVDWPAGGHANEVLIVAITPDELPAKPGVWKPLAGENPKLQARAGGAECAREQAAYLLDRTLQFYAIPVAYMTRINGELGSVAMYSSDNKPAKDADQYNPSWVERCAILEYIDGSIDRHRGNWLTHADDPMRPVLCDNGLTFPARNMPIYSPFLEAFGDADVSPTNMKMLEVLRDDSAFWDDLPHMVGDDATKLARDRMQSILATGKLTLVSLQQAAAEGGTTETVSGPEESSVEELTE